MLAAASLLPLLVWWLGWYPGILTSDSIDQLSQARDFEFSNFHPAFHSIYLRALTPFWSTPGTISLFQVAALAGLLALVAYRLAQLGVPWWLAGGAPVAVAALPAIGPTTISIWKDVPFSLALVWSFAELLAMARNPERFWDGLAGPLRLGGALSLVWLFRHNGFVTVVLLTAALAIRYRTHRRGLALLAVEVAAAVVLTQAVLYPVVGVDRASIEPSQTFTSDVAASLRHEPGNFSSSELGYLDEIAPLGVWTAAYDCHDSSRLVFHPEFDTAPIREDPGRFQSIVIKTFLRDPDTVLGHRWCAASYLLLPPQSGDSFFHIPPYDIAANPAGYTRSPISDRAFALTDDIYRWAEQHLWLTWRPALAIWAGAATYLALALSRRRRLGVLLWPGAIVAAQFANVALTTPAQEFRFAFGVYLLSLLSVPLLWLAARPNDAALMAAGPPHLGQSAVSNQPTTGVTEPRSS